MTLYFDRLRTVSTIIRPIVRHKLLVDGPTSGSWSKLLTLATSRILWALAVFREYVLWGIRTASILSVSRSYVFLPWARRKKKLREYTVYVLDFTQPVTTYHVSTSTSRTFFVRTFRAQALDWSPRHIGLGSISIPPCTLFYVVVAIMIPHYCHKERCMVCLQKSVRVFFTLLIMVGGRSYGM